MTVILSAASLRAESKDPDDHNGGRFSAGEHTTEKIRDPSTHATLAQDDSK
jgi:hypothetical protein